MTASPGSDPTPATPAAKHTGDERARTVNPQGVGPTTRPPLTKPLDPKDTPSASKDGRHAAEPSVGQLVSDATAAVSVLVRSEIELAKLELRATVKNAGTGIGLFVGAAFVLLFSLTFGFIALAEGIAAMGLDRWLAFLIVFVFQLLIVGLFVFIGIKKIKAVRAPEKTIKATKETVDYLKSHTGSAAEQA